MYNKVMRSTLLFEKVPQKGPFQGTVDILHIGNIIEINSHCSNASRTVYEDI